MGDEWPQPVVTADFALWYDANHAARACLSRRSTPSSILRGQSLAILKIDRFFSITSVTWPALSWLVLDSPISQVI